MLRSELPTKLTYSLEERLPLDVADGATDLSDDEIEMFLGGVQQNATFYLVGDVRHHLYRLAEIVATALTFDDAEVYPTRRHAVVACCLDAGETLIMTEVEVGLEAISGDVAFAVLVRVQRARVDVDVRVEFLDCYLVTAGLKELAQRGGDDALP